MSTYLPSLRQLQYLLSLHECGHFGRAAAANFVTQSTLSAGIGDLERLLGVVLVERTKRSVRFTAVGLELVRRASLIVRGAEDLTEAARAAAKPLTGSLRLAVIPTIAPFLLPRILPSIAKTWPELRLFVRESPTQAACDALHRGAIDCVMLALPAACGDVEEAAISTDRLLLAVPADDGPSGPMTADQIDLDRLLLLEDGHCLKDHALAVCDRPDMQSDAMIVATSLHTLVQMVDNALGVTLLPQMAVDAGILRGTRVVARPLANDMALRRIALVWRKGSARARDYRLLAETIVAARAG